MRILMTGHDGYVGSVMAQTFSKAGHDVVGLDAGFFVSCVFGTPASPPVEALTLDVRDVRPDQLVGFDAVVHLAALSNDPLGDLRPDLTFEINHRASVRLADLARSAGVPRFLFASSCSLYGAQGDSILDEQAEFDPLTPYGESKILAEKDISALANDEFSPTFLRNATAYGASPKLRADVVINNLVGHALTSGEVLVLSDGTPWRPLVHVQDFSAAFLAALEAPRHVVHDEAFNVGRTSENYQVSALAELVEAAIPGSQLRYAEGGEPDPRSYRVDCGKIEERLPEFTPRWGVERGIAELRDAFVKHGLSSEEFAGQRFFRLRRIRALLAEGSLDDELRWASPVAHSPEAG